MVRSISAAELLEIMGDGGTVERDNAPEMADVFKDVLSQLQSLIDTQRSQVEEQQALNRDALLQVASALSNFKGGTVDVRPLERLLAKMTTVQDTPRPSYTFDVERNSRGLLTGMTAKPATPVLN